MDVKSKKRERGAKRSIWIADSGSTKTEWVALVEGQVAAHMVTKGMNPYFQNKEEMCEVVQSELLPSFSAYPASEIYFYGAGCTLEKRGEVACVLQECITTAQKIEVASDILGAARATAGRKAGIVCILGTGSNSCFYDGHSIVANVSPLGFILGDEGSGAVLGKHFVGNMLKNQLGENLKAEWLDAVGLSPAEVVECVYRKAFPNRFLAAQSPFIASHLQHEGVRQIVEDSFRDFFVRNVYQYDYERYPVYAVGSIAAVYEELLRQVAGELNVSLQQVVKAPIKGLVAYHTAYLR